MLRSNLLKREGPCFSRRRSRSTQVDSDCKPLTPSGGCALSSDSVVPRAGDREGVVVTNDEEVTQPVSFVPTWGRFPRGSETEGSPASVPVSDPWRNRSQASSSNLDSAVPSASTSATRLSERRMKSWVEVICTINGGALAACLAFSSSDLRASTDGPVESLTSRTVSNVQILFRAASRAASGLTLSFSDLNVGCCDCACCTEVWQWRPMAPHCCERGLGPRTILIQPAGTSAFDHPLRGMKMQRLTGMPKINKHSHRAEAQIA